MFLQIPMKLVREIENHLTSGDWPSFLANLNHSIFDLTARNLDFLRCRAFAATFTLDRKHSIFLYTEFVQNVTTIGMVRSDMDEYTALTRVKIETLVNQLLQFRFTHIMGSPLASLPNHRKIYLELRHEHPDSVALVALDFISRGLSPMNLQAVPGQLVHNLLITELRTRSLLKAESDLSVPYRVLGPPGPNQEPTW